MDEISKARFDRKENARDVSPTELVEAFLHELKTGSIEADGVAIIWCRRQADSELAAGTWRANLSADEELLQLELAKERVLSRWLRRKRIGDTDT